MRIQFRYNPTGRTYERAGELLGLKTTRAGNTVAVVREDGEDIAKNFVVAGMREIQMLPHVEVSDDTVTDKLVAILRDAADRLESGE